MKIVVEIPAAELADATHFTNTTTRGEAVVAAVRSFNQTNRCRELLRYAGTCDQLFTAEELQSLRRC